MPRQRTELTHAQSAEIAARAARGESAKTIFYAVPGLPSIPTIARRIAELRAGAPGKAHAPAPTGPRASLAPVSAGPPSISDTAAPEVPDDVPEGTPIEQLDRWIRKLESALTVAEENGNLSAVASLAGKVATLMALRHRAMPLPKQDPNESPDMRALAAEGEARLLALVHDLFSPQPASGAQ